MTDLLTSLIDKQDNFEIIRDKITEILALEVANQMALASAAAKDPDDWKLRIFSERSNAWEQFLNAVEDPSPIVNVWFDNTTYDGLSSSVVDRQTGEGTFNIDCYGYGVSADVPAGGHTPGDREAAIESQRAVRLVRNILMASANTYLQLRGVVGMRWPQAITAFQPEFQGLPVQNIDGARIALRVKYNEYAPQAEGEALELISVDVLRAEDGEIVIQADYEHPIP